MAQGLVVRTDHMVYKPAVSLYARLYSRPHPVINTDHIGNGAVKIANSHKFTMPELAVTILRSSNSRSKLVFVPLPSDDPKQRHPDVALAKAKLGRKPKVNLKDDLKRQFLIFQGH